MGTFCYGFIFLLEDIKKRETEIWENRVSGAYGRDTICYITSKTHNQIAICGSRGRKLILVLLILQSPWEVRERLKVSNEHLKKNSFQRISFIQIDQFEDKPLKLFYLDDIKILTSILWIQFFNQLLTHLIIFIYISSPYLHWDTLATVYCWSLYTLLGN